MRPWLTIVGIGDDGLDGLTPAIRALIDGAELLVGGDRHQALVPDSPAERLTWAGGLEAAMDVLEAWRGRRVVVLASGDPMCFGAGVTLQRRFDPAEMVVLPVPGAYSLACARMKWSLPDTTLVTLHGRPVESFTLHIAPGARLVVLSWNGDTPAQVARLLVARGFGPSPMTVLEHLGGPRERCRDGTAATWTGDECCADLNTLAVECRPGPGAIRWSRVPGLPDRAFAHDGQLTKRAVRAATLAALAPEPGALLWDIGAGSGSVAIEWMRAGGAAVAVEGDPGRCATIAANAAALGVPRLRVVEGWAPATLDALDGRPDAVFVGGGVATAGVLDAGWHRLAPGGRLVANAVTIDGEQALIRFRGANGGTLSRLAVERLEPMGRHEAWHPARPVVQLLTEKSGA